MTLKFSSYFIWLTIILACKQPDKTNFREIDLDKLGQRKIYFSQVPDTVKKIFYARVEPKIIMNGKDSTRIYPNNNFNFIYIDSCKPKTELKSVSWILSSWFDHYALIVNGRSFMTTKKLRPPFIILNQKLYTSGLLNIVDTTEYQNSDITLIDLTGKLNTCGQKSR
jgi:hypothetical protein